MTLIQIDTGVHVWLGETANAGLVLDADGATIVDTLAVPSQYEPFAAAVEGLGVRVRRTVLTASTIDCVGGLTRFTMTGVYGRRQTSVHLDQPADHRILAKVHPEYADELLELEPAAKPVSHVVATDVQLTPAVVVLTTAGPQAENLVALVPGAGVLFAGAMADFGTTPWCYQGDPGRWADELERLRDLAPLIVPGHGPLGGVEEVDALIGYLRACVAADGDPGRIGPGPWDAWPGREHDAVNVERAALLAAGDDRIPDAFLRAVGLG